MIEYQTISNNYLLASVDKGFFLEEIHRKKSILDQDKLLPFQPAPPAPGQWFVGQFILRKRSFHILIDIKLLGNWFNSIIGFIIQITEHQVLMKARWNVEGTLKPFKSDWVEPMLSKPKISYDCPALFKQWWGLHQNTTATKRKNWDFFK